MARGHHKMADGGSEGGGKWEANWVNVIEQMVKDIHILCSHWKYPLEKEHLIGYFSEFNTQPVQRPKSILL